MRYKLLGDSGLRVSELCLGTMSFGEEWGFGGDREASQKVFETFAEAGGNFIDTANKYSKGTSERFVGEFVAADRERFVVATKYTLNTNGSDLNACGNHRKNMVQAVNASLKRLNLEYLDLLWVHAWDFTTPVVQVMRALDDLVRQGKVLHVAISDAPAWVVAQANTLASLRGWTPFSALQIEYSLIERTVERELLPMAKSFGLAVTPWAPLGGGVLSGKYSRHAQPQDTLRAAGNAQRLTERNLQIARSVDAIADDLGVSSAQVALNWVRQRGENIIPIVGARKASQIADSLKALDFKLGPEHLARLEAVSKIEKGFPHDFVDKPQVRQIVYSELADQLDWSGQSPGLA